MVRQETPLSLRTHSFVMEDSTVVPCSQPCCHEHIKVNLMQVRQVERKENQVRVHLVAQPRAQISFDKAHVAASTLDIALMELMRNHVVSNLKEE